MLDLQSYLLYELLMAHKRERSEGERPARPRAQTARFRLVPWALAALGRTLVLSGRKLQTRYEPLVEPLPQKAQPRRSDKAAA